MTSICFKVTSRQASTTMSTTQFSKVCSPSVIDHAYLHHNMRFLEWVWSSNRRNTTEFFASLYCKTDSNIIQSILNRYNLTARLSSSSPTIDERQMKLHQLSNSINPGRYRFDGKRYRNFISATTR